MKIEDNKSNRHLQNKIDNLTDNIDLTDLQYFVIIEDNGLVEAIKAIEVNNTLLETQKQAVNNLINFYNDVINGGTKLKEFQMPHFLEKMTSYSLPHTEKQIAVFIIKFRK